MEMMLSALTQHMDFVHFSKWQMSDFSFREGGINVLFPILPTCAPTLCDPMDCSPPGSSVHSVQFSSIQSLSCVCFRFHGLQHARPPCPSPTPRVHPNPCPLSRWCHPTISSSVVPFSSCLCSFPASGSFWMSQLFTLGVQSIGVSASTSVLPMNTQDWFPLGWTCWISL